MSHRWKSEMPGSCRSSRSATGDTHPEGDHVQRKHGESVLRVRVHDEVQNLLNDMGIRES